MTDKLVDPWKHDFPWYYEQMMSLLVACSRRHLHDAKNSEGASRAWSEERYEETERLRSDVLGEMVLVMEHCAEIERGAVWKEFNKFVTLDD